VVGVHRRLWTYSQWTDSLDLAEERREISCGFRPTTGLFFKPRELCVEDRALEFRHPMIAGETVMAIPRLTFLAARPDQHLTLLSQCLVVRGDDPALARRHVFSKAGMRMNHTRRANRTFFPCTKRHVREPRPRSPLDGAWLQ